MPLPVVVLHLLCDRPSNMSLAEGNQPIEALLSDRAYEPLGVGIRIWRAIRRQHDADARLAQSRAHARSSCAPEASLRVRCSTCRWCRIASTSSWSAARERAPPRRVRRSESSTDIIAEKRIDDPPQHQPQQQERTFQ